MRRPPDSVRFVAGTHFAVGAAVAAAVALVHFSTRHLPITFNPKAYAFVGFLAVLFLLTGTLVWLGRAPGRGLSRACTYLCLMRPGLSRRLNEAMRLPEFVAHFEAPPAGSNTATARSQ